MDIRIFLVTVIVFFSTAGQAASHLNKTVTTVHSPDWRPCTFFQLDGVTQADPVAPNNPWFAVQTTYIGHDVIVSILLTALTTNKEVHVETSGSLICNGLAAVTSVRILD